MGGGLLAWGGDLSAFDVAANRRSLPGCLCAEKCSRISAAALTSTGGRAGRTTAVTPAPPEARPPSRRGSTEPVTRELGRLARAGCSCEGLQV